MDFDWLYYLRCVKFSVIFRELCKRVAHRFCFFYCFGSKVQVLGQMEICKKSFTNLVAIQVFLFIEWFCKISPKNVHWSAGFHRIDIVKPKRGNKENITCEQQNLAITPSTRIPPCKRHSSDFALANFGNLLKSGFSMSRTREELPVMYRWPYSSGFQRVIFFLPVIPQRMLSITS